MQLGRGVKRSVVVLFIGCLLGGCSMRLGDFTVGSSKNIGQFSQKGEKVEGEDCSTSFFMFPISGPTVPSFKTAVDKALERAKGDVLADVVLWQSDIVTMIFNQHCFKVEGRVARAELGKK
ncbi:MAG: hypothetical protein NT179_12250 [Nitrospirae bacterium]|nr:hypothetical protein [Nitrospirota bacterium]